MEKYSNLQQNEAEELIAALQAELDKKERTLNLIGAVDRIRDQIKEPLAMLNSIVELIANEFDTDLCLLSLFDEESEQLELRVIHKRAREYPQELDRLIDRDVLNEAVQLKSVAKWENPKLMASLELRNQFEIVVMPIAINEHQPLGLMLMACRNEGFSNEDIECLQVIEDHIDSAVIQGNNYYELEHRHSQLALIYRVDQIRDQHLPLEKMLNLALTEVVSAIPSEMGFVMIYSQNEKTLSMRATTGEDLFRIQAVGDIVNELVELSLKDGRLVFQNRFDDPAIRSFMCVPLILKEKVIGVIGVINRYSTSGYNIKDRQLLNAIGSQIDTAIYETMEKRHLRQVLGRAVGPRIMEMILDSEEDVLKTEKMYLTVLYADIRGSTAMAEKTEPELLVDFMNDYLHNMNEVVLAFDGTLDKFVGDEVMALFGAPFHLHDHALRAVRVGVEMQRVHSSIMRKWIARGIDAQPIGIGIATGELIVGEMGSKNRTDYTVMGNAANLGARICAHAKGGEVLICPETYGLVSGDALATPMDPVKFKGVHVPTTVYSVKELYARTR
ncbi:MAG: adenylate/guanylate cyclase domain-containing protein [Chloroflexota bacterium]